MVYRFEMAPPSKGENHFIQMTSKNRLPDRKMFLLILTEKCVRVGPHARQVITRALLFNLRKVWYGYQEISLDNIIRFVFHLMAFASGPIVLDEDFQHWSLIESDPGLQISEIANCIMKVSWSRVEWSLLSFGFAHTSYVVRVCSWGEGATKSSKDYAGSYIYHDASSLCQNMSFLRLYPQSLPHSQIGPILCT